MIFFRFDKRAASLSDVAKKVYWVLVNSYSGKPREIYREDIKDALGYKNDNSISNALKELDDNNLITRSHKHQGDRTILTYTLDYENWVEYTKDFVDLNMPLKLKLFALRLRCYAWDDSLILKGCNNALSKEMKMGNATLRRNMEELSKYKVIIDRRFNTKYFVGGKSKLSQTNDAELHRYLDECCEINDMEAKVVDYKGYPVREIDNLVLFYNSQFYLRDNADLIFNKIFELPEPAREPTFEEWVKVCKGFNKGIYD